MLTIVMYHYVRELRESRYPQIKGISIKHFDGQLDHICNHYQVCRLSDVAASIRGDCELPRNACVLTFDDGFIDHYETVLPRLVERQLTGAFFPVGRTVEEGIVLDVHKIQFMLACLTDYEALLSEIVDLTNAVLRESPIPLDVAIRSDLGSERRFDRGYIAEIKNLLQWKLPRKIRSEITSRLFAKYVTTDEKSFASELYMELGQIREMLSCGMEIGGHGYDHEWLGKLTREEQSFEIDQTRRFLGVVFNRPAVDWVMCYPYGSYNADTLDLLSDHGVTVGLTTKPSVSDCRSALELERLDTNDLPVSGKTPA